MSINVRADVIAEGNGELQFDLEAEEVAAFLAATTDEERDQVLYAACKEAIELDDITHWELSVQYAYSDWTSPDTEEPNP